MGTQIHPPFTTMRPVRAPRRISVTVGPRRGDFRGRDDKIIQAAMDYVARLGGGEVRLYAGTYTLSNALFPPANVALRGSGEKTILRQAPGGTTELIRETDWFEYCVQVKDPSLFSVGCGIALSSGKAEWPQTKLFTVTAIDGNVLYLDRRTDKNYWMCEQACVQTAHSLIHGWDTDDVVVEDLVLDGNRDENPLMNGNYAAGVFLQYCDRWSFRNVVCRRYNGDGFSFQVCDDITFDGCRSVDNAGLGFHPGSGSQRPRFRDCVSTGNTQGLFWCWGVCDGLAERCTLSHNSSYGSNFGHRDTDNVIRDCEIVGNGDVGILFRRETNEDRTPDRNRIEHCLIKDNARVGIEMQWVTEETVIAGCRFESTRPSLQPTAIHLGEEAGSVELRDNEFKGCRVAVSDARVVS